MDSSQSYIETPYSPRNCLRCPISPASPVLYSMHFGCYTSGNSTQLRYPTIGTSQTAIFPDYSYPLKSSPSYSFRQSSPPLRLSSLGHPLTPGGFLNSSCSSPTEGGSPYFSLSSTPPQIPSPSSVPVPVTTSTPSDVLPMPSTNLKTRASLASSPPRIFFPPDFCLPSSKTTEEQIVTSMKPLETSPHTSSPSSCETSPHSTTPSSFGKTRHKRGTKLSFSQIYVLKEEFQNCHYISVDKRRRLSSELGISCDSIRLWFLNRRKSMLDNPRSA